MRNITDLPIDLNFLFKTSLISFSKFSNCFSVVTFKPIGTFRKWINNLIKNVDRSTFIELVNLSSLYMFGNLIKQLDGQVFKGLVNLESLDLHRNFIRKFDDRTFKGLPSLRYLDIQDNPLDSFDGNSKEFDNVEVSVWRDEGLLYLRFGFSRRN